MRHGISVKRQCKALENQGTIRMKSKLHSFSGGSRIGVIVDQWSFGPKGMKRRWSETRQTAFDEVADRCFRYSLDVGPILFNFDRFQGKDETDTGCSC
jgi:hypothetical protein